jgi:hypothetical protein
MKFVPDAPINLTNDEATTSETVIRFTWSNGSSNGGNTIIDYTVYYDQGTGGSNFVQVAGGVTTKYY